MKIDTSKLIKESGEKLTQAGLAREMVAEGLFKSFRSAVNTLQRYNSGKVKAFPIKIIRFLINRFNRKGSEIIQWDN